MSWTCWWHTLFLVGSWSLVWVRPWITHTRLVITCISLFLNTYINCCPWRLEHFRSFVKHLPSFINWRYNKLKGIHEVIARLHIWPPNYQQGFLWPPSQVVYTASFKWWMRIFADLGQVAYLDLKDLLRPHLH